MIEQEIKKLTEGLKMSDDNGNPLAGARWSPDEERRLRDAEKQYGKHGDSLRPYVTTPTPSPHSTRPTGGTVTEALEQLEKHALSIREAARDIETELTGEGVAPGNGRTGSDVEGGPGPNGVGIWDRLAAQIVLIERVLVQIDEAHHHAQASLK
jgi:hypothetical protein